MRRKIISLLLFALVFVSASSCSPGYIIRGAWEEAKILNRREEISKILKRDSLGPDMRTKLEFVLAAREFATLKGLNVGGSYSQYAEVDSSALVWVLTAAPKDKLEPMTWWFPFVGSVPYKGYFDKSDAESEAKKLEAKGFDTFVRPSAAFSTLGWFNDPVLSTMIQSDEVGLVDTVLHELLHRTLWVKGGVDFNESLANFVGGELTKQFFESRGDSPRIETARKRIDNEFTLGDFMTGLDAELQNLYKEKVGDWEVKKGEILKDAKRRWADLIEIKTGKPANRPEIEAFPLNNASILAMRIYLRGLRDFDNFYQRCDRDFAVFLPRLKELKADTSDGLFSALKE